MSLTECRRECSISSGINNNLTPAAAVLSLSLSSLCNPMCVVLIGSVDWTVTQTVLDVSMYVSV